MNNTLNRPISPILINKCIGVALLPVAGYTGWVGLKNLADFGTSSLVNELLFTFLPSACLLTVAGFCILFVVKAFQLAPINKLAVTMAFLQIFCVLFLLAFNAWLGDGGITTGDAGFAFATLSVLMFFVIYLPAVLAACLFATVGIIALSRPAKKEPNK
jgi:hypothetical protein